ncbi:MAG: mechanosensitive ion channel [Planctomycetes bacterium]|nr:mechanosensitive ion channel [Planctomycetota bacterium]
MRFTTRFTTGILSLRVATSAMACALFLSTVASAVAQPSPAPAEKSVAEITPFAVPKSDEAFAEVRGAIEQRLEGLPSAEPAEDASPANQQKIKAGLALRTVLTACLEQIDVYEGMLKHAAELASDERIFERTSELEKYRVRTDQLLEWLAQGSGSLDLQALADGRAEIAAEYKRINTLTDTTNKRQTSRQSTLAEFTQRESEATKAAADARSAFNETLKTSPDDTAEEIDTATAAEVYRLNSIRDAWQVFLADLKIEQLAAQKINLNLDMSSTDVVLPVLKAYTKALGDYRTRLETRASVGQVELIEQELATAKSPADKAYWKYRQLIADTQKQFLSHRDGIRSRFRESEKNELARDIKRVRTQYDRLRDRLSRISGIEKTSAYRGLADLSSEYSTRLKSLNTKLDEARLELDELLLAQDDAAEAMASAGEALKSAASHITDAVETERLAARSSELASKYIPVLDETIGEVVASARGALNRLEESVKEIGVFQDDLARYRQGLYWSYTLARSGNIGKKFVDAVAEVRSGKSRMQVIESAECSREQVARIERSQVVIAGIVLVVGSLVGVFIRIRAKRYASLREDAVTAALKEGELDEVGMTDRFRIQMAQVVGSCVVVCLPLGLFAGLLFMSDLRAGLLGAVALRLSLVVMIAAIARAGVVHLFRTGKARFRIIPCSNNVAHYYRRWGNMFWWLSVILAIPVVVLTTLDAAPALLEGLWAIYCALALLIAVLFIRNRNTVVRVMGRRFVQRRPIVFGAIVQSYPVVVLILLGLLIAELAGYGAFVDFIARNVVHTVVAFGLAVLINDVLRDIRSKNAPSPTGESQEEEGDETDQGFDAFLGGVESREIGLLVGGLTSVGQWLGLGAAIWICSAWGMSRLSAMAVLTYRLAGTEERAITVWRVIAAIVALFMVLKISKAIRATLNAKVYPTYSGINRGAQATINSLLHYMLIIVGMYVSFRLVHVNLGALAVLFGGLGLGLGLGLQPLLVNFMSGLLLYAERHVKVGDIVEVNGELGEVVRISMRSTQIKSFDNIDRIVPNSEFITSIVTNWTLNNDTKIRGKIPIGVAYGSDVTQVRDMLLDIAKSEQMVLVEPPPSVWFVNFGDSSLDFVMAAWFISPGDRWSGMINMRYEIDRRFKEAAIDIPFPQQTVSFLPDSKVTVERGAEEEQLQRDV